MWLTIPDDLQVHMLDRELVNYATGKAGASVVLPSAAEALAHPPTDPMITTTLAVLTAIAKDAQTVVQGRLLSQGVLVDPLPSGNVNAAFLVHLTTHIAFEHLFLRIPGQASEFPTAWDKSIKEAHSDLQKIVNGDIPLDSSFFTRGDPTNVPPLSAVMRSNCDVDAAFARDWNLPSRRRLG